MKRDYFKVPTKIYRIGLSPGAIILFCYLASCSEEFNPSLRYVSSVLKLSVNSLRKYYKELQEKNVIKCYFKGFKGISAKYMFEPINKWKI